MEGRVKERNQVTVEEFHSYRHENNYFLEFWRLAEGLVTKWQDFVFHGDFVQGKVSQINNSLLKTIIGRYLKIKRRKIERVLLYCRFCRTRYDC
jgi:hypothetical protein